MNTLEVEKGLIWNRDLLLKLLAFQNLLVSHTAHACVLI